MACFSSPAMHDLIGLDGRKLCGGAQRRTRRAFCTREAFKICDLPADFAVRLLDLMAAETLRFSRRGSPRWRALKSWPLRSMERTPGSRRSPSGCRAWKSESNCS